VIQLGEIYEVIYEANSEWSYVLDRDCNEIGWIPSYCFDDTWCKEIVVIKSHTPTLPGFISVKQSDTFKQIYDGDDVRYGFLTGSLMCGWVDISCLNVCQEVKVPEITCDSSSKLEKDSHVCKANTTPGFLKINFKNKGFETIHDFLEHYSFSEGSHGVREYLTKYVNYKTRKRYSHRNDKMSMLLHDFSWYNYLDHASHLFLLNVPYSVSAKVMDHGFFINARCNSAVVTSRIRLYTKDLCKESQSVLQFQ